MAGAWLMLEGGISMNATITVQGGKSVVHVSLSKRNLLTLLYKLDDPTSFGELHRTIDRDLHLSVTAEPNFEHYADREFARMLALEQQLFDHEASSSGLYPDHGEA
jgi:hypothetical protein